MKCDIRKQTRSYLEHAEAWKKDHDEVMSKYDDVDKLSSEITRAVETFDSFSKIQLNAPITIEQSKLASSFQVAWYDHATMLAAMVESLQNEHFQVPGIASLHQRLESVSQYIGSLRQHLLSLSDFELGNEIPVQG